MEPTQALQRAPRGPTHLLQPWRSKQRLPGKQGLKHPAAHTPFIFHFPACPCTAHLTTSAPICLEACVLPWAEFLEVSATPPPYGDCPSSLTSLPFLSVQSAARQHQENGARRKGLCGAACLWPGSQPLAGVTGRTLSSPRGPPLGSVLNHGQAGARLPWPSQFALKCLHLNSS